MPKCLLIIDMQKASFTDESPRHDAEGVINRINSLSKAFRNQDLQVIFIQHNGDEYIPHTPAWELLDELEIDPKDLIIGKSANDSFYNTLLESKLKELNATELIITGCATDFCVESTVQSALVKDYDVTVAGDAHTTDNKLHLSALKIIEHYNWIWKNLSPTKGKLEVRNTEGILANLQN